MSKDKAVVAGLKPVPFNIKKDQTKYWCACGRSKNQPFCDGSHRGTSFTSLPFSSEKDEEVWLCMCKQTKNPPYCDGSHNKLSKEDLQKAKAVAPKGAELVAEPTPEEPHVKFIHDLAKHGLSKVGHHGPVDAMGVPGFQLPKWDDIQLLVAQAATKPLLDDAPVATELIIGPRAKKPLRLEIPIFVSDMSFGALSKEAKVAMAKGADMAGTGICSGEGGMLPDEQEANGRYFYELASVNLVT